MEESDLSQGQRQLIADLLVVMRDHPADELWQAWQDGDLLDRIELDGTTAVVLDGGRTYRQTHDCSVIVDDRSDPRTQTCQIFRIKDGQPVMPASLEDRLGEWQ